MSRRVRGLLRLALRTLLLTVRWVGRNPALGFVSTCGAVLSVAMLLAGVFRAV